MPSITDITPDVLKGRHRLSVYQINNLLGYEALQETREEKALALGKVAEFLSVTDLLRDAGINFIALKGPLLSYKLYGDATVRLYNDLDILIDASLLDKAVDVFHKYGFAEEGQSWPSTRRERTRVLRYGHHILFYKQNGLLRVELHWLPAGRQWSNFRDLKKVIEENLVTVEFSGRSFRSASKEVELMYLIIHGSSHRWEILRWLEDIRAYMSCGPLNDERLCRLIKYFNCGRLVGLCNSMLSELFPGERLLPCASTVPTYMEGLSKSTITAASCGKVETVREILVNIRYSLSAYSGLRYKVLVLMNVMGSSFFWGRLSRLTGHGNDGKI